MLMFNKEQKQQGISQIKEFNYLRNEWTNPSKDSNKIKLLELMENIKTNTAGVN